MGDSSLDTIALIAKKVEKQLRKNELESESLLKYLDYLSDVPMSLDILTKTGIGLVINQLRHKAPQDVDRRAKKLIRQWRTLIPSSGGSPTVNDGNNSLKRKSISAGGSSFQADEQNNPSKRSLTDSSSSPSDSLAASSVPEEPPLPQPHVINKEKFAFHHQQTGTDDKVRIKSRELLQKALEADEVPSGSYDTEYLSVQIESAIFREFNDTDIKYKNRLRSRVMNLRDRDNPQLRLKVLLGHVSAERFSRMTSQEMASDEMKKMRDEFTKEAINEHQLAVQSGTETDLIKCRKCGKNKCIYTQLQTRSSDEPMTTFVYCSSCGHRFKFC